MSKRHETAGRERLAQCITPSPAHISAAELAERLGVSASAVRQWAAGTGRPGLEHMAMLEQALGIPLHAWLEAAAPPPAPSSTEMRPKRKRARSAA